MALEINRNHAQLDEEAWKPWARKVLAESLQLIEKDEQYLLGKERELKRLLEPCPPSAQVARLPDGRFTSIKKISTRLSHIGGKITSLKQQKQSVQSELQKLKPTR